MSECLPNGPLMIDVAGHVLDEQERQRLRHPLVGGIILFRRNFASVAQLRELVAAMRAERPNLLITVDHEGGRVQRFLDGFTRLPPMRLLGECYDRSPDEALALAADVGEVLAAELRACDIDLSYTPVLDLDYQACPAIGNRSFHRDPAAVTALAQALLQGLQRGGMASCGKHFPGHGFVDVDSHLDIPRDERSLAEIRAADLQPFVDLVAAGMAAVMPAHVIYPQVDDCSAGFSRIWLQDVLRGELGFDGMIFSDDLSMEGAAGAGGVVGRVQSALAAGCDMALVCNRPDRVDEVLASGVELPANPQLAARLAAMRGQGSVTDWQAYLASADFARVQARVAAIELDAQSLKGPAVGEAC